MRTTLSSDAPYLPAPFLMLTAMLITLSTISASNNASAQSLKDQGAAANLFLTRCASCHGDQMQGGMAGSLLDTQWKSDGSDKGLTDAIANGIKGAGMPAWKGALSDEQIRSLVILIREQRARAEAATPNKAGQTKPTQFSSQYHDYTTHIAGEGTSNLWGLDFLPDGSLLATQRNGTLWRFANGKRHEVTGIPTVWVKGQGGLLDVFVHPGDKNAGKDQPWVYLSFAKKVADRLIFDDNMGATTVVRGKIKDNRWIEEQVIFEVGDDEKQNYGIHYGSRFAWQDGYLFFTTGEENKPEKAQNLALLNGKVHRLHDDGRIPKDNPFVNEKGAMKSVWSYGHRNPQGLDIHPVTGELWESEHGPRGGDEINRITRAKNYGWPLVTYGMHYDGRPISAKTSAPGMEDPIHYWVPSIATCGIEFYDGASFPQWRNHLFVAGLRSRSLHRLKIDNGKVTEEEKLLPGLGRIRDMTVGPDGDMYVIVNDEPEFQVIRVSPTKSAKAK